MSTVNDFQNADSAPYFEAAAKGRLVLQKCNACGHVQFPPRHTCSNCWNDEFEWADSPGKGIVESFTVVHRAPTAELREATPYVVAAIMLEEGVRLITNLVGDGVPNPSIGDSVAVTFEADAGGNVLPLFRLT